MRNLSIQFGNRTIPFWMGHDCLAEIAEAILAHDTDGFALVTDESVFRLYGQRFLNCLSDRAQITVVVMPDGEKCKSLGCLGEAARQVLGAGFSRGSMVISLGGGAVGNLAGLLAALLFRGVRFVHVPTTLLAMHDSVTSQKQAVNLGTVKNILGTYHIPTGVFCDGRFLETLTWRSIRSGLVELVKNALVFGDPDEVALRALKPGCRPNAVCLSELALRGVECKAKQLLIDPFERTSALAFEYGHTVGHALELHPSCCLSHGEAVEFGMRTAARVSLELGLMTEAVAQRHEKLLSLLGASEYVIDSEAAAGAFRLLLNDNKRGRITTGTGQTAMVLLCGIGRPVVTSGGLPLTCVDNAVIHRAIVQEAEASRERHMRMKMEPFRN